MLSSHKCNVTNHGFAPQVLRNSDGTACYKVMSLSYQVRQTLQVAVDNTNLYLCIWIFSKWILLL